MSQSTISPRVAGSANSTHSRLRSGGCSVVIARVQPGLGGVPRGELPARTEHVGRRRLEGVDQAPQRRGHVVRPEGGGGVGRRADARLGEGQQVLGAGLVEAQRPADRPQHVGRGVDPAALLEPRVPGDRHPGEHRHLLAAQARGAARPPGGAVRPAPGDTASRRARRNSASAARWSVEPVAVITAVQHAGIPHEIPRCGRRACWGPAPAGTVTPWTSSSRTCRPTWPTTSSSTASGVEDGRVFLSGVQAVARLPVDQLRIDRRHGLQHRRLRVRLPGLAGRDVPGGGQSVGRGDRARPARSWCTPGAQRGAGGDVGDGQPARRLPRRQALRRRARRVVRQGARASTAPATPSATACSPAPPATAAWWPSSATTRRRSRRRCPARATPRSSTCTCRSSSPATCRRRSTSAATPSRCRGPAASGSGSSSSRRSPTAPAPSTSTPTASCRWCRRWSIDGKPFVPHPSGRLLTPYTLDMEREFQQVRSVLARRYGVANKLNRVTVGTERRLDRHRRQRADLPRAARGAGVCSGSTSDETLRARRHPPVPAARCRCRSTRQRCASSPTASPRCSWSRRRTRPSSCS